jgi:RNA polymerase sigma-54 factor
MFHIPYHSQRPATTAHLAQTMTLLSLTAEELRQQIESEIASNPALEMVEERRCPTCHRPLPVRGVCPICTRPQGIGTEEPIVFISPRDDFFSSGGSSEAAEESSEDNFSTAIDDLPTFVMRQIISELNPDDRRLAAYLLTHLDEDGLLTTNLLEAARYHHVPVSKAIEVQRVIQHAEPVGVGSSTPQEALLMQIEVLSENRKVPILTLEVVRDGMDLLSRRQYPELARQLHTSSRQIQEIEHFISENLNPYPARSHWGDVHSPGPTNLNVYHHPDIIIGQVNEDGNRRLVVEIIMPLYGTLRVNPLFRQVISQAEEETRDAWRNDLDRASLFVKCLQQRNHTMQRLMQRVTVLQRDFILNGEKHLKSVTRVQLSKELDVHESTISRAVANKAVQLPNGRIVPLSTFFDRNLNVRTILRELIASEPRPLSDTELASLLSEHGFDVARRTVAKYRSMEGILPAHLRHAA